uniref:WW domain-containing protein n=1 Tax=Trichogramma kaykai TaxID=54128 RepID=A0ABD2X750_9HYME
MSLSHENSTSAIVCKEVFDENSHPSEKEVFDYARRLGIDPDTEPHLLDLAREGLMAALPKGWRPIYDEVSKNYYYYQKSTKITTWEHPLDPVYKDLVAQARLGIGRRRISVDFSADDDTLADAESSRKSIEPSRATPPTSLSGLPPAGPSALKSPSTRIPMKLAPLKRHRSESGSMIPRRAESSLDRYTRGWRSGESVEPEPRSSSARVSLSSDRASRDYTNLTFKDPEFYEKPKLLESNKRKSDIRDVLKRSESLSPRHEKDWHQLNIKLSSENIIDVDKLRTPDTPGSESAGTSGFGQARRQSKELTLSGGGSMFLKSNRSRDTTPCQDDKRTEMDFQIATTSREGGGDSIDDLCSSIGERLKSILREPNSEHDDKPVEEERKSVRFDLQRVAIQTATTKFNESGSEEQETEESDPDDGGVASHMAAKRASLLSLQQVLNRPGGVDFQSGRSFVKKVDIEANQKKIIGKRFIVENITESEHLKQQEKNSMNKLSPMTLVEKNQSIDLMSKSDFDNEFRKNEEALLDIVKKLEQKTNNGDSTPKTIQSNIDSNQFKAELICKHKQEIDDLKQELNEKLIETRKILEEEYSKQRQSLEINMKSKLLEVKKDLELKEDEEVKKLIADMDEARAESLKKIKSELEVCYEKERQDILTNLKGELDQRKRELLELRSQEISKLETEHEKGLGEDKQMKLQEMEIIKHHNEKIELLKKELDKEFDQLKTELRAQQKEKIAKITEDHEKSLADILRDFRVDEGLARKVYKQRLEEVRADYSKDIENELKKHHDTANRQENVEFEKIRCEKRLIEDKYNTLKEKYLKLKKDMRAAIEKRNRRKELVQANATASETEISTSAKTRTERTESLDQKLLLSKTNSMSKDSLGGSNANSMKEQTLSDPLQCENLLHKSQSLKFESDDTTTCSETTSNLLAIGIKKKKCLTKKTSSGSNKINNNMTDNPVENIRKQLEQLEDIGDHLPTNDTAYRVRYPFQDKSPTNVSSELEFFKHRIHVERDSVKRAREALRQQRSAFQSRQKAWKQHSVRATLEQIVKEERELSDMEISLHRTRSLLGEKVIHLRHLEQSLERVANTKRNENDMQQIALQQQQPTKNDEITLSDMSSASSGFSSNELGSDTFIESTEIIASLENLNSEIREIWGVLNKRQDNTIPPPPNFMSWFPYQHLAPQSVPVIGFGTPNIQSNILSQLTANHPPGTTQNIIAQYGPSSGFSTSVSTIEGATSSNLSEKTRNLKDWLRQARVETSDIVSSSQATL